MQLATKLVISFSSWQAVGSSSSSSYSSKDLGALYYEDKRHLGEMIQQASVLKLVEEG